MRLSQAHESYWDVVHRFLCASGEQQRCLYFPPPIWSTGIADESESLQAYQVWSSGGGSVEIDGWVYQLSYLLHMGDIVGAHELIRRDARVHAALQRCNFF